MKTTTYWEIGNVIGEMRNVFEDVTGCAGDDLRIGVHRRSHGKTRSRAGGRLGTQLGMKETVDFGCGSVVVGTWRRRIRIHSKVSIEVEEEEEKSGHIYSKRS